MHSLVYATYKPLNQNRSASLFFYPSITAVLVRVNIDPQMLLPHFGRYELD